jgi:hypothetical protein
MKNVDKDKRINSKKPFKFLILEHSFF